MIEKRIVDNEYSEGNALRRSKKVSSVPNSGHLFSFYLWLMATQPPIDNPRVSISTTDIL